MSEQATGARPTDRTKRTHVVRAFAALARQQLVIVTACRAHEGTVEGQGQ